MKGNILVSACLLGEKCRYDGEGKPCAALDSLKERYNFIPICPEVLGGLKTPRDPSEIRGGKVVTKGGADNTKAFKRGAQAALEIAKKHNCKTAILKSKSPSCGRGEIYDGSFTGTLTEGNGTAAALLIKNGIRVLTENEI